MEDAVKIFSFHFEQNLKKNLEEENKEDGETHFVSGKKENEDSKENNEK